MYKKLGGIADGLLSLFVPKVDAAAASPDKCYSYPACWQCNKKYGVGGICSYNAPCAVCSGVLLCDAC
jgi:hypothetical protein